MLGIYLKTDVCSLTVTGFNSTCTEQQPPSVLQDLEGVKVTSTAACAEQCDLLAACNGASYYPDPEAVFNDPDMKNCWMKTFEDPCAPPAEAVAEPLATLILKPLPDCALHTVTVSYTHLTLPTKA